MLSVINALLPWNVELEHRAERDETTRQSQCVQVGTSGDLGDINNSQFEQPVKASDTPANINDHPEVIMLRLVPASRHLRSFINNFFWKS